MSQNQQRMWSESLNSWYIIRRENGRLVGILPDGRRIAIPANLTNSAQPAANEPRTTDKRKTPSAYQSSSRPFEEPEYENYSTGPSNVAQATNQMATLGLGNSAGAPTMRNRSGSGPGVLVGESRFGVISRVAVREGQPVMLLGSDGDAERLDPKFRKRSDARRFFRVGKVFFTLWTEPTTSNTTDVSIVSYGERVYSQIRRFVVTREGDTYCEAVPITTYGGQATLKRGVDRSQHAIIYTGAQPPPLRGESGLVETLIAVDPIDNEELDPKSRVNLGTPYTIQHNLKVKPCGMVRNVDAFLSAVQRARIPRMQAREAPPSQNVPITPVGRPSPNNQPARPNVQMPLGRGNGGGSAPQGYNGGSGQPWGSAGRGDPRSPQGQLGPAQYRTAPQAIQQARAMQQRQAQGQATAEDDSDEDEDSEEDEEDEPRRYYQQPRQG